MIQTILVGNPNCGKTTLFNALTHSKQRVGNWPGVTVEKKMGRYTVQEQTIEITDLPGIYSLTLSCESSQDEQIAAKAIIDSQPDLIINVVDACHLERHLYLTSQLAELGKPLVIALTMTDIAKQRGIHINIEALSQKLGCPVIPLQAQKKIGITALNQMITGITGPLQTIKPFILELPNTVQTMLRRIKQQLMQQNINSQLAHYYAYRLLEGDQLICKMQINCAPLADYENELDILVADARYQKLHRIVCAVQNKENDISDHFTAKLDRIILHRFLALPIFLAAMYLMFLVAVNVGGAFQDFFDIATDTIFVQGGTWLLQTLHAPAWLIALLANGLGKGINTVLTFIPVIASMFFFLSLLEVSGYMARAAFVVDKVMRALGLPGKAFIPMIVGFGCNVPAIMATRTLDSERDRLLTVLMSPFMSCSARLAIYAVFVAAFFPHGGQNVVFSLYIMGILMAILTGFLLRKTRFHGKTSPLILELPVYHKPKLRRLWQETSLRLRHFVIRAGRLIIPICIILGGLNALTLTGTLATEADQQSILSLAGKCLTPLFSPMGLHQDNWPATVGLLTGILAKEVVVGSLNSLYAQLQHLNQYPPMHFDLWVGLKAAFVSIPHNLGQLSQALANPILASAPDGEAPQAVYRTMAQHFDGKIGAYAYLLFVLLYIPCVSTMAVVRQEAGKKLMWFSIGWSFLVAYATAVIFYQLATLTAHPQQSIMWVLGALGCLGLVVAVLYRSKPIPGELYAFENT